MKNPISRKVEYYKTLDAKDKRSFWIDGLLNNAIYIILVIFLLYFVACWPISMLARYLEKKWR